MAWRCKVSFFSPLVGEIFLSLGARPVAKQPAFTCPNWGPGQRCKPYIITNWLAQGFARVIFTLLGVAIALAVPLTNFGTAYTTAPPAAPLALPIIGWGVALILTSVGSIFLTLHHEIDSWGCFVAGIGTPTLLVTVMTALLPHL